MCARHRLVANLEDDLIASSRKRSKNKSVNSTTFSAGYAEYVWWIGNAATDEDFAEAKARAAEVGATVRRAQTTEPAGWKWHLSGWWPPNNEKAERHEHHRFTVTTDMKPGLVPMYFSGTHVLDPFPILQGMDGDQQQQVVDAIFETNRIRCFVIGPAITPGSTEDDLRELVERWASEYGFSFLHPFTAESADFRSTLDELKPATDLDKQIVECLRAALQ
jgi:hypothetical protein